MGALRVRTKRAYDPPEAGDGRRFLVDRLWPRGVKKAALGLDGWLKDLAPGDALRRWFGHDPGRWDGFLERYFEELDEKPDAWRPLLAAARSKRGVTLLFAARDVEHNNAVALKRFLETRARTPTRAE